MFNRMFYEFLQDPPIFLEKKTRVSGFPVQFSFESIRWSGWIDGLPDDRPSSHWLSPNFSRFNPLLVLAEAEGLEGVQLTLGSNPALTIYPSTSSPLTILSRWLPSSFSAHLSFNIPKKITSSWIPKNMNPKQSGKPKHPKVENIHPSTPSTPSPVVHFPFWSSKKKSRTLVRTSRRWPWAFRKNRRTHCASMAWLAASGRSIFFRVFSGGRSGF